MTHLAETRDELELLAQHRGVFVEFLQRLGAFDPAGLAASPADVIRLCSPAPKLLLAHGNYLGDEALPAHATVVYCPRTHQAFGHDLRPVGAMLARGVRIALGTDSLASSPDLDMLAEARLVRRLHPALPGEAILRMATLAGAEALGFDDETGSLEPGKSADLIAVEIGAGAGDPHDLVLRGAGRVSRILFKGYWIGG
jgi:cytosine/adenosine deaminase-related metal-dependent hydrolase